MYTMSQLGERIRDIRQSRGLSRGELSKRASVAVLTILKIEVPRYNYSPSVKILSRIAKGLEIDVRELL